MQQETNQLLQENLKSRKMREQPIGKLLLSMSVPAILSMLVMALYNVVDTIFISYYSPESGVDALGVAYPLQMLIIAFAVGIGVGTNAQIAKKLGEGKHAEANMFAKTGVFMAAATAVVFAALAFVVSGPFVRLFAKTDEIADMSTTYLTIVMALSFGSFIEVTCSKILQATGNMKVPMISQLIGAGINIILDPLLIFGIGFFPEMGVAGAAVATVAGQIISMGFVLIMFVVKKHDVSIWPKGLRLKKQYILGICAIGLPTMVMNAITSVTTTAMNAILKPYDNGIAILAIYFKMQSFVFMPVFGLTQGLLPILSYNYGTGDKKRFAHAMRLAVIAALCMMTVGLLLFQFCAPLFMKMFSATGTALTEGALALRIISICFLPAAFGITLTTMLQSLGKGFMSLIMSLMRQVALILPFALLFSFIIGMNGVWISYPLSEAIVACTFLPLSVAIYRKKFASYSESAFAQKTDDGKYVIDAELSAELAGTVDGDRDCAALPTENEGCVGDTD